MKLRHIGLLVIFVLLSNMGGSAQDFQSDPEVAEIRARVADLSWKVEVSPFEQDGARFNTTYITFEVITELWNPYDTKLVSYGSSSCRWHNDITTDLTVEGGFSRACTEDLAPREYTSGLSNETSSYQLYLINTSYSELPDGSYFISGGAEDYANDSDYYYGLNMTVVEGEVSKDFDAIPLNWGQIRYSTSMQLNYQLNTSVLAMMGLGLIYLRHRYSK